MPRFNLDEIIEKSYKTMEFEIKAEPFLWNENLSAIALEDFSTIQKNLSYGTCQSIGMALAKLKLLEEQGCKVKENSNEYIFNNHGNSISCHTDNQNHAEPYQS